MAARCCFNDTSGRIVAVECVRPFVTNFRRARLCPRVRHLAQNVFSPRRTHCWGSFMNVTLNTRKGQIFVAAAVAMACSVSGAFAQTPANCGAPVQTGTPIGNIGTVSFAAGATSSALSSAIGNVNTAFLTTQGSAFVSAPSNPAPDQPGGGVWARGVGGQVTDKSTTNGTVTASNLPGNPAVANTTTTRCANSSGLYFLTVIHLPPVD